MKYYIITFGCQMNLSDSEKIANMLKKMGHQLAENEKRADLIVINSCSVRQTAMHRVYEKIDKFYKNKKVILAGCVLPADQKKYKDKVEFWHPDDYFNCAPIMQSKFRAYVPIMTGCDNFCSYCAVPYTRGREKSRPAEEIITEMKSLIKRGYKEIILLGQNVNSYKSFPHKNSQQPPLNLPLLKGKKKRGLSESISKNINFSDLLKLINAITGNFWLNFISSHPKDMSDELIETIAKSKKITPYIHLPVQSGDDEILKKMNRHYTVAHYRNLIKKLKAAFKKHRDAFPPVAISTDIIVGFPGETKKQFLSTAKLCRQLKFDMIYFAQYSPRPGTAVAKLPDDVSNIEKKRRAQTINEILKKTALANNQKYIGQTIEVLIEEIKCNSILYKRRAGEDFRARENLKFALGKTPTNKTVRLPAEKLKPGDLITIKITKATAWGLTGKISK